MSKSEPLVSVVIPTFNRESTLARAIDSAFSQTYPNIEVVVSDNASTDGTELVLARYEADPRVRILRQPQNVGPVANWLQAIQASLGEYTKVVWSDDWMERDTVAVLMAELNRWPSAGFAVCPQTIHLPNGDYESARRKRQWINMEDMIMAGLGMDALPVSPGAAIVKRTDALWALESTFPQWAGTCADRAIGPDLLMLFASLRLKVPGRYVGTTRVHFEGGGDSITMTSASEDLTDCYWNARAFLVNEVPDRVHGVMLKAILIARGSRVGPRGRRSDLPSASVLLTSLTTHASLRERSSGLRMAAAAISKAALKKVWRAVRGSIR